MRKGGGIGPSRVPEKTAGLAAGKARSLSRGLEILEMIRDHPDGMAVQQIIDKIQLPRASAYQLIAVLLDKGFLARASEAGSYILGRQSYRLALGYRGDAEILRIGRDVLRRLRDETGETAQLSVLDRDMNLVMLREEGRGRLVFIFPAGTHVPINWSASGCLLVSDWSDAELTSRLPALISASPTGTASTDLETIVRLIRSYREQGHAVKIGEVHPKVANIAAPVIDESGCCVAAITLVAYELSLTPERLEALISAVSAKAREMGARIAQGS